MVKVIQLEPGMRPPSHEPFVLIEWSMGTATSFSNEGRRIHYVIGQPKHRFWSIEAILMAARLGFDEIYYIGQPSEHGWPSAFAQRRAEAASKRRDNGARRLNLRRT